MNNEFLLEIGTLSLSFITWKKWDYVEERIYKTVVLSSIYEKWSVLQI